jgi:uncharacterized membrane protein YkoI
MSRFLSLSFAALLIGCAAPGVLGAAVAEDNCVSDWSEAAPIVREQGLMPVEKLTPAARAKLNGEIVKVTLCKENGLYVFRLVVRGQGGAMRTVTVDAKNPF